MVKRLIRCTILGIGALASASLCHAYQGGRLPNHNHTSSSGDGGGLSALTVATSLIVTGPITATSFVGNIVTTNSLTASTGTFTGPVTLGSATVNGSASISSSLTVSNQLSASQVGGYSISTSSGIQVTGGGEINVNVGSSIRFSAGSGAMIYSDGSLQNQAYGITASTWGYITGRFTNTQTTFVTCVATLTISGVRAGGRYAEVFFTGDSDSTSLNAELGVSFLIDGAFIGTHGSGIKTGFAHSFESVAGDSSLSAFTAAIPSFGAAGTHNLCLSFACSGGTCGLGQTGYPMEFGVKEY